MHKIIRFMFSRVAFFSVLIVLQLFFLIYFLVDFSSLSLIAYLVCYLASIIAVVWLVTKDENPSYKISWIILIMAFPILGGLFYITFGNKTLPPAIRRRLTNHRIKEETLFHAPQGASAELCAQYPRYATQTEYIRKVSSFAPYAHTAVTYCPVGEVFYAHLLEELPKAEKFIFMEYFIIEKGEMWDSILTILKDRAAHGVEVAVLYDDFGCIRRLPVSYAKELEESGIKAVVFNRIHPSVDPSMNYRDHRKICVIDGKVGFCGGINLADEYINRVERFGHWKDTAVMLRGDAVQNLTRMFLQLWTLQRPGSLASSYEDYLAPHPVEAEGYVQPYSDTPLDHFNVAESVYMQIINRADRYVYITTPYLILDNEFVVCLKTAAESGIDVRIIMPSHPDKWYVHMVSRSYYLTLMRSGVKIYEYNPGFVHAKMFVSDDNCAVVGTANLDYRSLFLHYENSTIFYHAPVIADVKQDILDTLEKCHKMTLEELESKFRGKKVLVALLKLLAPLM